MEVEDVAERRKEDGSQAHSGLFEDTQSARNAPHAGKLELEASSRPVKRSRT